MTDTPRTDTEQLLTKLGTVSDLVELDAFRDGLKMDRREPPSEVIYAIARKRVELARWK
jgi:hypothetical protein